MLTYLLDSGTANPGVDQLYRRAVHHVQVALTSDYQPIPVGGCFQTQPRQDDGRLKHSYAELVAAEPAIGTRLPALYAWLRRRRYRRLVMESTTRGVCARLYSSAPDMNVTYVTRLGIDLASVAAANVTRGLIVDEIPLEPSLGQVVLAYHLQYLLVPPQALTETLVSVLSRDHSHVQVMPWGVPDKATAKRMVDLGLLDMFGINPAAD